MVKLSRPCGRSKWIFEHTTQYVIQSISHKHKEEQSF